MVCVRRAECRRDCRVQHDSIGGIGAGGVRSEVNSRLIMMLVITAHTCLASVLCVRDSCTLSFICSCSVHLRPFQALKVCRSVVVVKLIYSLNADVADARSVYFTSRHASSSSVWVLHKTLLT